jgi:hypothetical protein
VVSCSTSRNSAKSDQRTSPTFHNMKLSKRSQEKPHNSQTKIFCHTVPGFSLVNKRWCFFLIDSIEEFEYNTFAFESLLLAPSQKMMIHSLIKIHKDERLHFDDIIKGKGKGMVFLLHGEPGVGKTLTAGEYSQHKWERIFIDQPSESVADYTQRPLYTITSGDLGVDPAGVERTLLDALELAAHWNAIVLLDEADIFLEQRSNHDLQRNGLVSGRNFRFLIASSIRTDLINSLSASARILRRHHDPHHKPCRHLRCCVQIAHPPRNQISSIINLLPP